MCKKIILACLLLGVPCWHGLMTLGYLAPPSPLADRLRPTADSYVKSGGCQQRWSMFAPEPSTGSPGLWYRVDTGGGFGEWIDPAAPMLRTHQLNRLATEGKRLNVHQYVARELFGRVERTVPPGEGRPRSGLSASDRLLPQLEDTPEYRLAVRYVCERVRIDSPDVRPRRVELAVVYVAAVPYSLSSDPTAVPQVFGYVLPVPVD